MLKSARIAVFVSGGGTNLQALLDAQRDGKIPHGEIALVISSQACAYALERAEKANVPAHTVPSSLIQHDFEAAIELLLEQYKIDVIVLAGFLSILSENFTKKWPRRILNIHPSLIPSFCGRGMYGLKVHEAALARGVKVTGATVHFCQRNSRRRRDHPAKSGRDRSGRHARDLTAPRDGAGRMEAPAARDGACLPRHHRRGELKWSTFCTF